MRELGLKATYTRYHLQQGERLVQKFRELRLSGANVTLPHKEHALAQADIVSDAARQIGSANTLVLKDDKIFAYNTDGLGFMRAIANFNNPKTALILGAGGTSKALAYALSNANIGVEILNRSADRLADFAQYTCYAHENFTPKSYDLVINSTSAGLKDNSLPLDRDILSPTLAQAKFAFDVIYGRQTPFLCLASELGLQTKDGAQMLLFQAVFALNLFFDNKLDEAKIERAMKFAMSL